MEGAIYTWFFRMVIYTACIVIIFGSLSRFGHGIDGIQAGEILLWAFLWNAMVWVFVGFEGVLVGEHGLKGKHWTTRVYWITSYIGIGLFFLFFAIPWGIDFS